jgi:hypothetical protein
MIRAFVNQLGDGQTMKRYITASIVVTLASAFGLASAASASVGTANKPKTTKAESSLINNNVPPATASSCKPKTADEKKYLLKVFPSQKAKIKGIVAAVECFPTTQGSPDEVDYVQMGSLNDLLGLYQANLSFYNLPGGPGPSANAVGGGTSGPTASTCPAEDAYGPANLPARGRFLCHPSSTSSSGDLVWTNEPLKIYSEAFLKTDPNGSLLRSFFNSVDSGPEGG